MTNLDCLSVDPADYFAWYQKHATSITAACELFPDRPPGYIRATRNLADYAASKGTAMNCRSKGDIQEALRNEARCDRIYATLPAFAKW